MKPLRLSIIIPFYNVEQFISQCLDSVFDQDIPLDEYEVICVNDGSPDKSRDIVMDYMNRFPNLRLVEHDRNRKLGAARNTGRSIARGNYIWNVDSDDKIVPNCLAHLLNVCEANDLDVLEFGRIRFWGEKSEDMPNIQPTENVVSGLDYMEQLGSDELSMMCVVWRRLMRRVFLEENHIYSPEINMGEDVPFSFRVLMSAKRMMVIPARCYYYRANPDSLTGKQWMPTPNTLYEKCFVDSRLIYDVAKDVPKEYTHVRSFYFDSARYTLNRYGEYVPRMAKAERKEFRNICKKNFRENRYVKDLLSKKRYMRYFLWLNGFIALPG